MEVTLSGRMGGPEAGIACLPAIVAYRQRLKAALAPLAVDGLAVLDITLHVGGSITDSAAQGFTAQARYLRKPEKLTVAIHVPRRDAEAEREPDVAAWLLRGLESMPRSASVAALDLDAVLDALRAAG
ncbi:hypothetical protein [Achromobacter insuavis]|uniref:hypothetical protein n=1 Tax=Achromobacter insuavis TaxID=1287735 RepID=UPI001F13FE05|nr:hypothetical protein [Achromobacter insuavis]MCG2596595.1 hypothetical protein [Achromobacter sp.]MCG2596605.1 hypothetical protein [Achromobacter sp.]MCG2603466.1 hypothetical protein [Achromobacter sp.]